jgi:hypothetical protein
MVWWLFNLVFGTFGGGAAVVNAVQGVGSMLTVPGMVSLGVKGAMESDLRGPLRTFMRLGTLAFICLVTFKLGYGIKRVFEEEYDMTETGCVKWTDCGKLSETTKKDPHQIKLCDAWKDKCHRHPLDRGLERLTDAIPTLEQITETWHYKALAACTAVMGLNLLFSTGKSFFHRGKKAKRAMTVIRAEDLERLQESMKSV